MDQHLYIYIWFGKSDFDSVLFMQFSPLPKLSNYRQSKSNMRSRGKTLRVNYSKVGNI